MEKRESLPLNGSFKEHGALFNLLSLTPAERARGVVPMSAGNHAQAVAYHAGRLGTRASIVMPRFTPNVKVEHTRGFGAEVLVEGEDLEGATAVTERLAAQRGSYLIPSIRHRRLTELPLHLSDVEPPLETRPGPHNRARRAAEACGLSGAPARLVGRRWPGRHLNGALEPTGAPTEPDRWGNLY